MQPVTAEGARQMELTFLGRFDQAVRRLQEIRSPVDGRSVRVPDWEACHHQEPALAAPSVSGLVVKYGERGRPGPRNLTSLYRVDVGPGRGAFVIGALFLSHVQAYQRDGVDTAPVSGSECTRLVERALDVAVSRGALYVLEVLSPTGFDAVAQETIAGSAAVRGFGSPHLALCLHDLAANALFFNPADERITRVLDLFSGELEEDTVRRVAEHVRSALLSRDSQSIAEVARATSAPFHVAHKAFTALESQGGYVIDRVKGLGHVISRRL